LEDFCFVLSFFPPVADPPGAEILIFNFTRPKFDIAASGRYFPVIKSITRRPFLSNGKFSLLLSKI